MGDFNFGQTVGLGAVGTGLSVGANLLQGALGIGQKRTMKRQVRYTNQIADHQAELNEKAADAAAQRQKEYYDYTYDKESYAAMVKQMRDAGLSVGLMYGGGGAGGAGGGSTGAAPQGGANVGGLGAPAGSAIGSPLDLASMQDSIAGAKLKEAQAEEAHANADRMRAEQGKTEAETKTIDQIRNYLVEHKHQEAVSTWIDNINKMVEGKQDPNENDGKWEWKAYNDILDWMYEVDGHGKKNQDAILELTRGYAQTEALKADKEAQEALAKLNNERAKGYYLELIAALTTAGAQSKQAQTAAEHLAWTMGNIKNAQWWINTGLNVINAGANVAGAVTRVGMLKTMMKGVSEKAGAPTTTATGPIFVGEYW